ncbi:HNH endonuclease [Xanthomonas campestris pv. raphani]|uniref:HNH endonuclease n=1 Tax=Xanthomonas campestris TaxID=339 RepID=UPI002B23EB84|nr:HNH endonuclease [Xanthomonas campestris]MEA9827482.1 HNH endonuclease [Xanthomonas campestris pv. raphani]
MLQSLPVAPCRPNKCINCLEAEPDSEEHIFAEGAGGSLSAYILCRDCNEKFGKNIDSPYLKQPTIELARNAYRIRGKRNIIPQPLSGPYLVPGPVGQSTIKLDIDFKPRIIPQIEDVFVLNDDAIQTAMVIDAADREKIPRIVRSKLERFFNSEKGIALGWSEEEKKRAIDSVVEKYMSAPDVETPVGQLKNSLVSDFGTLFFELAKVAFEIAAIEDGDDFIHSEAAAKMRGLLNRVEIGRINSFEKFQDLLNAFHAVPLPHNSQVFLGIQAITGGKAFEHHIALLIGRHIIVSMFGDVYLFADLRLNESAGAIYMNDAVNGKVTYLKI